jgi:hypothetical protein
LKKEKYLRILSYNLKNITNIIFKIEFNIGKYYIDKDVSISAVYLVAEKQVVLINLSENIDKQQKK